MYSKDELKNLKLEILGKVSPLFVKYSRTERT